NRKGNQEESERELVSAHTMGNKKDLRILERRKMEMGTVFRERGFVRLEKEVTAMYGLPE
ncbi:4653_t:CDS:2, partial [Acaulospora morrowiae]